MELEFKYFKLIHLMLKNNIATIAVIFGFAVIIKKITMLENKIKVIEEDTPQKQREIKINTYPIKEEIRDEKGAEKDDEKYEEITEVKQKEKYEKDDELIDEEIRDEEIRDEEIRDEEITDEEITEETDEKELKENDSHYEHISQVIEPPTRLKYSLWKIFT